MYLKDFLANFRMLDNEVVLTASDNSFQIFEAVCSMFSSITLCCFPEHLDPIEFRMKFGIKTNLMATIEHGFFTATPSALRSLAVKQEAFWHTQQKFPQIPTNLVPLKYVVSLSEFFCQKNQ
jgi:hypothetical protein